jgi:hypothetical protein
MENQKQVISESGFAVGFAMDGDQWSCHIYGKNDLQKDPFGFGPDKKSALQHLLEQVGGMV